MSSVVRMRLIANTPSILVAIMIIVAAQLVTSSPGTTQTPRHPQRTALQTERAALKEAAAAMAATIVKPITPPPAPAPAPAPTTTTTVPPTPAPAPTPAPPPAPAPAPAAVAAAPAPAPSDPGVVPPIGQATSWGCAAALAYLQAYAAKGFSLQCPGYAEGREAMTCMNQPGVCPGTSVIAIADACPQAYMNEVSNSFVLTGVSSAPIDPFGPCP